MKNDLSPLETPDRTPETGFGPRRILLFENGDFGRYLAGRLALVVGQQMLMVAVGWQIYERTHSAFALGFIGFTEVIAMLLLTLPAGHIADNYDRKHVVMAATALSALASLGLWIATALNAAVFWIYLCLFVLAVAQTFLRPASAAFITGLVSRRSLSQAVAWNSSTFQLACIVGPAAGGALIAFTKSAAAVYLLNVFAALAFFGFLCFVRSNQPAPRPEKMTLKSLMTGFNFVFANRLITGMLTLDVFAMMLGGAVALLPAFAKDILHVGPERLGLLQAAMPLGAFCCALFVANRPPMRRAGRALIFSVAVFGLATILFGISKSFWLSFCMLALCGLADNVSIVVRHTSVQLIAPDEKRGRVSAVNSLFVVGASDALGGFESGVVAHFFGPVISVVSGGIGTVLVVLVVATIWPEIRRYDRLDGT